MIQTANITGTPLVSLQRMAKDLSIMSGSPLEDCMDAVCQLAHKRVSREDVAQDPEAV